ncbi:MAG: nuclear transport factor 2 family protein [Bacteroidetes bacterium]|nr:nuclear transport factor 2 family protein [Bacteroidota bacterium]
MKKLFLFLVCFGILLIGCKTTVNLDKEKTVVSERFQQWINAFGDEDAAMLENLLCDDPDMIFFGSDASERWIGKDEFIAAQKEFFEVTSESKIEAYNTTIKLSRSGTVAWTSLMMNWDILSGDQPMHLEGIRMTCVFEKRDNNWVVVQVHGSAPVSGQMVEY